MQSVYIQAMADVRTLAAVGGLAGPHLYAERIARGIAVVAKGGGAEKATITEWADSLLYLFMAMPMNINLRTRTYKELDETPESVGYYLDINGERMAWHHRLRIVRNHDVYGPKLFKVLFCEHTLADEAREQSAPF